MEKLNGKQKKPKLKKIVVIGPESTGKSTLASLLAKHYNTEWVPEYAREYMNKLNRPYIEKDLLNIARGQIASEIRLAKKAKKLLICDTNLLVLKVWSEHKFGGCYPQILDHISMRKYDLYLLTYVDLPWEEDPQREDSLLRNFYYDVYKNELKNYGWPFVEIKGEHYERKKMAIQAIDSLLKFNK